jgi:hypothetical protein
MTEKPGGVKQEVLRGQKYSAGVCSAENVTCDQSAKHDPRFLSTAKETFSVA